MKRSRLFKEFLLSERLGGLILIVCAMVSIALANSKVGTEYIQFWHSELAGKPVEFWVNDVLMTFFFLLVGLEIERELYGGELSQPRQAILPVVAAIGGMMVPALMHYLLNRNTETVRGFGIPTATDIAFSLAVLSLLGNRVPYSLKIFLTAFAIIDDLGAILVIAIFYSQEISYQDLCIALALFALMLVFNRLKYHQLLLYFIPGGAMWYFMYRSGIHPTISGVLLAFAIPFGNGDQRTASFILQRKLHGWVALLILPLFALANTAIPFLANSLEELFSKNSLGILSGLVLGKPVGIYLFSMAAVWLGLCKLSDEIRKRELFWISCLGGIGFTMSIFITLLAFNDKALIDSSKLAVILASVISGVIGYCGLRVSYRS